VVLDRVGEASPGAAVHLLHALLCGGHFPVRPHGAVPDQRDEIAVIGVEAFLNLGLLPAFAERQRGAIVIRQLSVGQENRRRRGS
jgi:hypothetical protein